MKYLTYILAGLIATTLCADKRAFHNELAAIAAAKGPDTTPPTFVSASSNGGAGTDDPVGEWPANIQENDVAIMAVNSFDPKDHNGADTEGFTKLSEIDLGATSGDGTTSWYWKRLAGTETSTFELTNLWSGATGFRVSVLVYRGVTTSDPPIDDSDFSSSANNTDHTTGNITTTVANTKVVTVVGWVPDENPTVTTTWTNSTERIDTEGSPDGSGNAAHAHVAGDFDQVSAATVSESITLTGDEQVAMGIMALLPE